MSSIFEPFFQRAIAEPDTTFCHFWSKGNRSKISLGDAAKRAAAYATYLTALGVKSGEIVVIILPHSVDLYTSFIGCVLIGAVPSFLPPLTQKQDPIVFAESMRMLLDRIAPAAAIVTDVTASHLETVHCQIILTDEVEVRDEPRDLNSYAATLGNHSGDSVAFLQHSSGTTGLKKGVMLSHRVVFEQAEAYGDAIGIKRGDVVVSWLPLYHDMGLFTSFLIPSIVGAPIVSIDALEWVMRPTMLLDAIQQYRGAFVWMPNFAFQHIVRLDNGRKRWDFSSLKALISCSEPCRKGAFERFAETYKDHGLRTKQLGVSYALAENAFAVTQTMVAMPVRSGISSLTREFLSCGKVINGVQVDIRPHQEAELPPGAGEIWITSPSLFEGYYKLDALSKEKLIDGWYRTGDIGFFEGDELFVVGRFDDLLVINGKNLFAHEVEDSVGLIAGLAAGRVLVHAAYNPQAGGSELIVLAETAEGVHVDTEDLIVSIRKNVHSLCSIHAHEIHLLPRGFLLKSSSGKISRTASYAKFLSQSSDNDRN